jgi:hypothetical protein
MFVPRALETVPGDANWQSRKIKLGGGACASPPHKTLSGFAISINSNKSGLAVNPELERARLYRRCEVETAALHVLRYWCTQRHGQFQLCSTTHRWGWRSWLGEGLLVPSNARNRCGRRARWPTPRLRLGHAVRRVPPPARRRACPNPFRK